MRICEYEFETEDPNHAGYSFVEVDRYSWIPKGRGIQSHRLSLRKNLTTGEFEVYRSYTSAEGQKNEVIYSGNLQGAVDITNEENKKYFNANDTDVVCDHTTWSCARRQIK
jgi:hypothetical protein